MVEHFEALEADFARYYQTDLPAALWGPAPISARRAAVLVHALPDDSATARAATEHPHWRQIDELLATIAELVDVNNRAFIKVYSDPHSPQPEPIKIRRPWERPPERATATSEEMAAFFRATTNGAY